MTGASTGIGAACVDLLVEKGFLVFASVRKDSDAAALTARHGASVIPLLFDVTDAESIAAAARDVEARLEGETLAGLVNNAGVAVPGPLLHLPIDDFRRQIEVNLIGQLRIIQAFAPLLGAGAQRRGAPGRIVNMSSVAGRFAAPFLGAYAASKFGLEGMSDALRRELIVYGVDVVLIEPGMIATPIWDKAEETDLADVRGHSLCRARPEDAEMACRGRPPRARSRGRRARRVAGADGAAPAPPHPGRKKSLYGLHAAQPIAGAARRLADGAPARPAAEIGNRFGTHRC